MFKLTLAEHRRFHTSTQIYRILHKLSPSYLDSTFSYAVSITDRTGRNAHRLYVPSMHLNYMANVVCIIVVRPPGTVCQPQLWKLIHYM